jgi:hypothetical protein
MRPRLSLTASALLNAFSSMHFIKTNYFYSSLLFPTLRSIGIAQKFGAQCRDETFLNVQQGDHTMSTTLKQVLAIAAIAAPISAFAAKEAQENSNHAINKKAVAMEAKEDKLQGLVRDWSAIDVDKDHAISPAEMQSFLEGVWNKKSSS